MEPLQMTSGTGKMHVECSHKEMKLKTKTQMHITHMAFPGTKHNWSEAETDTLWSYVEKFHEQLYHGKDNLTRPKVLAKITSLLSMSDFSVPCTAVVI